MKRWLILGAAAIGSVVLLGLGGSYGANLYYAAGHGTGCADCHEMSARVREIHGSPHRNASCTDCHEASVATKLRHVRVHLRGGPAEEVHLRQADLEPMMAKCQTCHQHEYAAWHAGPHSATYSDIFVNAAHNGKRQLMNDCFRCHGMYFNGSIRDVVQPVDTRGPWRLTRPELANQATIPCQACHSVHREGALQVRPAERISVAGPAVRDSVALYDRREGMHFGAASLAIPVLYDAARPLKISPDRRQGICYQCHAPRQPEADSAAAANHWGPQAGSGDDRTPMGVHEGISCLACHGGHNESARASCATCHPAMSHCGIDVEKMDTTFASKASAHNIHWVRCTDCHQHGVPQVKTKTTLVAGSR
jgi:Cytochrome c3